MTLDLDALRERYSQAHMGFALALSYLKRGHRIAREGWNGKGMWVRQINFSQDTEFSYQEKDYAEGTLMPITVIKTPGNQLWAWNPSQQDVLADDWMVVGPVYVFALYQGPEAHPTLPTFRMTLKAFWEHKHLLDSKWERQPHQFLSPRFSRVQDSTYVFDGPVEAAMAEMFMLGWESPEDFRDFVSKG